MRKLIVPIVAVLIIAGALIASPILARDDDPSKGCCPAGTQPPINASITVCPMASGNADCCPPADVAAQGATVAAAETAVPPSTICPMMDDTAGCPMGQGGGCGMNGSTAVPHCPVTSVPPATGAASITGTSGCCGMMR